MTEEADRRDAPRVLALASVGFGNACCDLLGGRDLRFIAKNSVRMCRITIGFDKFVDDVRFASYRGDVAGYAAGFGGVAHNFAASGESITSDSSACE
eukprot:8239858-Pyramimonas_sp.AAC.1